MRRIVPCLLCMFLILTGCSGNPLPEGMEEGTLLSAGWDVVDQMIRGNYETVAGQFRADVEVTAEDLQDLLESAADGAGDYVQHEDGMVTGQESGGERYGVAVLLCQYREAKVLFRVAFDTDMELIGMEIRQQ